MNLRHVVITSVTRDDLEDGGAALFAASVKELHEKIRVLSHKAAAIVKDEGGKKDGKQRGEICMCTLWLHCRR